MSSINIYIMIVCLCFKTVLSSHFPMVNFRNVQYK